jgi:predicted enzyme related to lactoylglutathione lyase
MGSPVVHFEVYGRNAKALQGFYSEAFGWEIHADNPMNYGLVHTNADSKGIDGGVAEGDPRVNFMVEVPDLEASIATIESLGGKVVTPITVIPNMVTYAEFADPEGNVVGIVKAGE